MVLTPLSLLKKNRGVLNVLKYKKEDSLYNVLNDLIEHYNANNKIKIDSSAKATLFSLTKKTTEKINKLEAELKKLEVSEGLKKEHGTGKVKYMHKVLEELQ